MWRHIGVITVIFQKTIENWKRKTKKQLDSGVCVSVRRKRNLENTQMRTLLFLEIHSENVK